MVYEKKVNIVNKAAFRDFIRILEGFLLDSGRDINFESLFNHKFLFEGMSKEQESDEIDRIERGV